MPSIAASAMPASAPRSTAAWCRCARSSHNGDQVEIVTQKGGTPSPAWERFVVTGKARSCIRRFIRTQQRTEYRRARQIDAAKSCASRKATIFPKRRSKASPRISRARRWRICSPMSARRCNRRARCSTPPIPPIGSSRPEKIGDKHRRRKPKAAETRSAPLTLQGLIPGMAVHYARCCHPLPGDRSSASSPPARASPFTPPIAKRWKASRARPNAGSMSAGATSRARSERYVGRLIVVLTNQPNSFGSADDRHRQE